MTPEQREFCDTVSKALRIYEEYHPSYEITAKQDEEQDKYAAELTAVIQQVDSRTDLTDVARAKMLDDAHFLYYRNMNKILREVSGVGVPEPAGTGDPKADYRRAMNVIDR
jgi:hypothetical protein